MSDHKPTQNNIQKLIHLAQDSFCGITAGTVCAITGHPFDTVKVKMQVFPTLYKSPITCSKNIIVKEGLKGFYSGFTPAMACNVLENGVLFLAYPSCCQLTSYIGERFSPTVNFSEKQRDIRNVVTKTIAGSFASIFASLVISPTEMVKCRLQSLQEKKSLGLTKVDSGVFKVISDIVKNDGPFGIYRGLSTCMTREFFGYFLIFGGYESTNYILKPYELGSLQYMLAGGIGGVSYWSLLYPIDVVKSRVQVLSMEGNCVGIPSYAAQLYKTQGIRVFYSGITPTVIRAFVANAFLFATYENCQKYMKNK